MLQGAAITPIFKYNVYGFNVDSPCALPLEKGYGDQNHISLKIETLGRRSGILTDQRFYFNVTKKISIFQDREIALFEIAEGRTISILPLVDADFRLIAHSLLGTPFGILLLQRGYAVFHGCCIEVRSRAISFLGSSGAGKSTVAASLISRGHKLISDDVVALNSVSEQPRKLVPGYPWMKVSQESVTELKLPVDQISELHEGSPKSKFNVGGSGFSQSPGDLKAIYIPMWADDCVIEPVKQREAVLHLVANGYGFVPQTSHPVEERERFLQYTELAKQIPCFLLKRPRDISNLLRTAKMVEAHLQTLK